MRGRVYHTASSWCRSGVSTALRRRVNRFYNGIKNKFPHDPVRDRPLSLRDLSKIATHIGIAGRHGLYRCSARDLIFWVRLIAAHGALLRPVEHSRGMQVKDLTFTEHGTFLLVGRRKCERKLKGKSREVPVPDFRSRHAHLSAAVALRVLYDRIHKGCSKNLPLFPTVLTNDCTSDHYAPWHFHLDRLRHICCEIGITGKITGRSLRSGGCTDLFAIGASREYVRHQGGWGKGYTFDIYDRPSPEQRSYLASKYGTRICNRVISLL